MLHQKSKRERERERENHSSNRSRIASFETRYRSNALRAHARDYYIIDAKNLDNKSRVFIPPPPSLPLWSSQQNSQGITFRTRHASLSLPATSGAETGYNYKRSPKRV